MSAKRTLVIGLVTAAALAPASALAKNGDIQRAGTCTKNSTTKIKLKLDNGRIETEFQVDQNRNGIKWTVKLRRNGTLAATANPTTHAPSGSFTVRRTLGNGPGPDTISGRATSPSGEVCTARATMP